MKDNKIDIMCNKIGGMIALLHESNIHSQVVEDVIKGMRILQTDLEILRKCTLDNPDFKWDFLHLDEVK